MPVHRKDDGWYWGSKGPFDTKQKAIQVGQAAYASGYREEVMMDKVLTAQFIGTLLHSATITHFKHFVSSGDGSYSRHKALRKYYEGIVDLVDSLTESIQGAYDELVEPYPPSFDNSPLEPLGYMRALRQYVRTQRAGLPQDSEIQNEIDSIATLINHTVYRLTFLK